MQLCVKLSLCPPPHVVGAGERVSVAFCLNRNKTSSTQSASIEPNKYGYRQHCYVLTSSLYCCVHPVCMHARVQLPVSNVRQTGCSLYVSEVTSPNSECLSKVKAEDCVRRKGGGGMAHSRILSRQWLRAEFRHSYLAVRF